jgi:hypothetical protein
MKQKEGCSPKDSTTLGGSPWAFEKTCDVLVCGAGIAGVAAALEAARSGMDTLLVEKTIFPGGLATTGLVNIYLPICDGNGRQVSFGLAEELLHLCTVYGPGREPADWRDLRQAIEPRRYRVAFSPASYILALDEVLEQAGVRLLFDALACAPVMENRCVAGVAIENKSGRGVIRAHCVVDATGDADIAFRAGVPCVQGPNRLSIWAIEESCQARDHSGTTRGSEPGPTMVRMDGPAGTVYGGTDGDEVSAFALASRRLLRDRYRQCFAREAELRHIQYPVTLPSMLQYRTTRRIEGRTTLQPQEDWLSRADSVGLVADWRRPGSVWEIPYGSLVPVGAGGLLVAGRCMAATDDAWQVTRVIPAAAVTGQACGAAATLAARRKIEPISVPIDDLQQALRGRGLPLHLDELYTAGEQSTFAAICRTWGAKA